MTSTATDPTPRPILITGAAGFIGSHLVEALLTRGMHVIGVDNFDPFYDEDLKRANVDACRAHPNADRFTLHQIDIRDRDAMFSLAEQKRPEGIIHIAARAGVRPSIEDPVGYADVNVTGTAVVLEASRRAGCSRVVVASSSSVYGNNRKVPFSEEDPVEHPISPYAATKRACELICHTHHHLTGIATACIRFFTVYGPRQRPDLAIRKFMALIADGRPVPFFGDGTTSRDFTYVDDIVAGVLASYDRIGEHGYRIWNLGGNEPVTLSQLVERIGHAVGTTPKLDRLPRQPGDVDRTWADLTRSGRELGFAPGTSLDEGLARQWAWMQAHAQPADATTPTA